MGDATLPTLFDPATHALASRLRASAQEVTEPQRSRILRKMPDTLFISHTSLDDGFIKGLTADSRLPAEGSIWWICGEFFSDPFYHSLRTGGADSYERVVGLALLASTRVLVIWSENAWRSNYVRAELLTAIEDGKKIAVYVQSEAPSFPLNNIPMASDHQALRTLLGAWR
jgi:hypothetical protein